jgi:predicted DNA-binding transcriptional regulator AlpA
MHSGEHEKLWDVTDVAAFLKVPRSWVYERTRRNSGPPCVRIDGRHIRFVPSEVRAWAVKLGQDE